MLTALFKFLPNGRLTQLLLLAVTVLVQSVMAIAVANSIFVSQLGAERLPLAFILIGLCSMPAYVGVSQVVQRVRSTQLFCGALVIFLVLFVGLRLVLPLELTPVYYGLLVVSFFQWDICNNILYPSLLTDYFNTLEYKQYAPYIGISQAVGTLIGGGIVSGLSRWLDTENLLLCLPGVIVISFLQLTYLDRTQRPLTTAPTETVGVLESLQSFPELTKRYPLVIFLATSSFLLVIIYLSSEFLWFSIYGQQFSQRDLTGFLGLMRVVVSIVQMAVLYGLTRPLLRWLGVARMNVVFPLTTLMAFVGLGLNGQLPAAIGLQINGDALYKAINLPVHQLNYNAIPQAFLGRIRALSDGVIYAVGLTCAGVFLLVCEHALSLEQISWVVCSLVVVFLMVRLPMGRFYAAGLEDLIRTDAIDLDRLASRQSVLPLRATVETLLRSEDRYDQIKGLDLATRFGAPLEFLEDVLTLLPGADRQVRSAVVTLFSDGFEQVEGGVAETAEADEAALWAVWQEQLGQEQPLACRLTALEILMVQQQPIAEPLLAELSGHEDASLQALALVAQLQGPAVATELPENLAEAPSMLDEGVAKAVIRVVARSADGTLLKLLVMRLLPEGTAETKRLGLETLAALIETMADDDKTRALALAQQHLSHSQPAVRIAALDLWQQGHQDLTPLIHALGDSHPRVRNQAAQWLAAQGGLAEAQVQLDSGDRNTVNGAISTIGQIRTRRASDILYAHLAHDFQQVSHTRQWQTQIPRDDPNWQPLAVAIDDYHYRLIQKVLYVLSSLGHSRTVNTVNQIFVTTDSRDRSNAVEVLASLSHRRFVLPLLPLLEQDVESPGPVQTRQSSLSWLRKKGYKILLEAIESKDRWLRAGALIALAKIPRTSLLDVDPMVRAVAHDLFPTVPLAVPLLQDVSTVSPTPDTLMNRLLILKDVALFQNLSLDELLLIDEALVPQQFMASETVFEEGSWGSHLYIIASGTVQIVKTVEDEQREIKHLEKGNYFGEIALFDDAPRWNGAIARDDCMLLKLEKQRFISLTTQRPHILLEICRFMSQQLRETDKFRSAKKFVANTTDVVDETFQSC
ncbi:cyclic nucleotide-binding domain-containing protein [Leptolyngbya cf. ectocarpi LEGE 11479]|uniref:Cyclic nucleotide-binding domain-containing protein n=1 Tax=Leptolyngbya cf. ectocarpi LEGE 11479 TaxID=1828722 RepID=A0A928ZXP6_LEPEC|nr:cyclic nucleotide-binding domain-containing protein [Leptolyngbya ectocarpi]MBE9069361.1 cyclic nucleotide-binding domain-containing protein [Leptolyngbya cf. ectocarpi LEGE 11479]